jgi:outer membrane beta-barrel protein
MRATLFSVLLLISTVVTSIPDHARAAEGRTEFHDRVYVLQPIESVVRGRINVTPTIGYIANDAYFHQFAVGGDLAFHITEAWAVGGNFSQYFNAEKPFYDEVQRDYAAFPENVQNEWGAGGFVTWAPIRGKVAFYPFAIMHLRVYAKVGAGALKTSTSGVRPMGSLGAGLQFLYLKYFGLTLEASDQMYTETYSARNEFKNQFLVTLGFTFLIPVL